MLTKKIVFLLFLLLVGYIVRAQVSFGFKGGLNICRFIGPDVISGASTLTSGNFGIIENVSVFKTTTVEIEQSVSWEGENFKNPLEFGSFKFTYFNMPVVIRQKIEAGLFVETGPQLGLLLNAKQTITTGDPNQPGGPITSDYSNSVKSINFGWDFGAGYKLFKFISLGVRYNLGLSNLGSKPYKSAYRNSVFSFNAFFIFPAKNIHKKER